MKWLKFVLAAKNIADWLNIFHGCLEIVIVLAQGQTETPLGPRAKTLNGPRHQTTDIVITYRELSR